MFSAFLGPEAAKIRQGEPLDETGEARDAAPRSTSESPDV